MNCPNCQTQMVSQNRSGDPLLRTRGLLVKGGALVAICPNSRCKGDVPLTPDVMNTLHKMSVLFFKRVEPDPVVTRD